MSLPNSPKSFIKDINEVFIRFKWNNRKDKIKRMNLMWKYEEGGLLKNQVDSP